VIKTTVEYVGFRNGDACREYHLRSHVGAEVRDFTVGIALAAFTPGYVRLQDGPEICYLKIVKELEVVRDTPGPADFTMTDAELADYITAHKPTPRRTSFSAPSPRPGVVSPTGSPADIAGAGRRN
jgi:hypothetical protein